MVCGGGCTKRCHPKMNFEQILNQESTDEDEDENEDEDEDKDEEEDAREKI